MDPKQKQTDKGKGPKSPETKPMQKTEAERWKEETAPADRPAGKSKTSFKDKPDSTPKERPAHPIHEWQETVGDLGTREGGGNGGGGSEGPTSRPSYSSPAYGSTSNSRGADPDAGKVLDASGELALGVLAASIAWPKAGPFTALSLSMTLGYGAGALIVAAVHPSQSSQYQSYQAVFDPIGLLVYANFKHQGASEDDALEAAGIANLYNLVYCLILE